MLVLSRQRGEVIVCTTLSGDRIEVVIVDVKQGTVRVGVDAPIGIAIHRKEVQEKIERERKAS